MVTFPAYGLAVLEQPSTFWFIFLIFVVNLELVKYVCLSVLGTLVSGCLLLHENKWD